jgi:hypothetical protein
MNEISGIVGLDLSITGSGVCRLATVRSYSGTFTQTIGTKPKDGNMMQRNAASASKIMDIIERNDIVLIENYAFGVKKDTSKLVTLAEFGGLIKFAVYRKTKRLPLLIASGTIKKWLSNNGNLNKEDFKMAAYKKYNIEFATGDEVIAYSMVDFGFHLLFPPKRKLFKYEEESIKNFKKKHSEILHICAGGRA